ncbi:MAG: hypothetical protein EOO02_23255, partial [Chitinophagaceae bacterium]
MNLRITLFICLLALASCSDDRQGSADSSDSAIDAARNFVQSALVGDFDRAEKFMVDDSLNKEDLNTVRRLNERLSKEEKDRYQEASIRIHQDRKLNDSTEVV